MHVQLDQIVGIDEDHAVTDRANKFAELLASGIQRLVKIKR
jgi:hypothetical protein